MEGLAQPQTVISGTQRHNSHYDGGQHCVCKWALPTDALTVPAVLLLDLSGNGVCSSTGHLLLRIPHCFVGDTSQSRCLVHLRQVIQQIYKIQHRLQYLEKLWFTVCFGHPVRNHPGTQCLDMPMQKRCEGGRSRQNSNSHAET